MHILNLEVTDQQLAQVKSLIEKADGDLIVHDPMRLLRLFFENELKHLDCYITDDVFGSGANSLGDVLDDDVIKKLIDYKSIELKPLEDV